MTDIETIKFLWRFMVRSDELILAAAMSVPAEKWEWEQGISWGSLAKQLNHARNAQRTWITRLKGTEVAYIDEPPPAREEFGAVWAGVHRELLEFADGQTPESIQRTIQSRNRAGKRYELPVWAVMLHVSDHATYHWAHINTMIKRAGGTPTPVMVYTYCMAEGIGREL
jgi:uncharacterized damage-inducible protein DinB